MKTSLSRFRRWVSPPVLSAAASVVAIVGGPVLLLGWRLDLPAVTGIVPGLPKVAPTTALGLTLAGVALGLLRDQRASRGRRLGAAASAIGVSLIGLFALIGYLTNRTWVPGPPSFYTSLVFVLLGAALLLLDARPRRGPQPSQLLALVALHIVFLAMLGQAFRNPTLYVMATAADTGMSLPGAVLAAFLGVGILSARPETGFTAILRSTGGCGVVARRLLFAPIGVLMFVFFVVWGAQRAGLVGQNFGGWLFTTAYFTGFTLIIWWVAGVIRRAEAQRDQAECALRDLNDGLERRVADRTAELTDANRHLALRNQENETFVYTVSHDLRSPLVNLQGFSKELAMVSQEIHALLADDRLPSDLRQRGHALIDEDMAESIRFIQLAVTRLGTIIEALLRLSRAGRVQFQMQVVDLNVAVGRIIGALHGTIHERGARVIVGDLPPAWGDPTAVEQVFANLIGNALNYLDPGRSGVIEIGVSCDEGNMKSPGGAGWRVYHVRDNGRGIPEAHRSKVFQAFQRLHPDAAPGEGMGLAIVHRIVERHGGKIWLDSAPGAGTTFFVVLPATAATHRRGLLV